MYNPQTFADELAAIDRAYLTGALSDWLKEKLADEQRAAGIADGESGDVPDG